MPVIKALPSPEIIKGFRGVLDFYVWRGLNCVRTWPRIPYANRSPKSLASAAIFGLVVQSYALLGGALKTLFIANAQDQPRTGRDLFISAIYGHLHETNMADFLDLLTQCTEYLSTLTDLVNALASVGTDELRTLPGFDGADHQPLLVDASKHAQIDVLTSALPSGAATDTKLDTQITALEKIDDLQAALESFQTDRLQIRGEDQLLSFKESLAIRREAAVSGINGYVDSPSPPAGFIWQVKQVGIYSHHASITLTRANQHDAASDITFHVDTIAYPNASWHAFPCTIYLEQGDVIRVDFTGAAAGNWFDIELTGRIMTLET